MIYRISILFILLFTSLALFGQQENNDSSVDSSKNASLIFQGDSRRTFVDRNSVGILGARLGLRIKEKYEFGLGVYSSNLFGILQGSVEKDYIDNNLMPPASFPSEIGFHYASIFGEYRLLNKNRIVLTLNTQIGAGWVDIDFEAANPSKPRIREPKILIEHSAKADVLTFDWLRLIGGVGYRYLILAEPQIKSAFNAPIYIVGFSIDFKLLRDKLIGAKK